MSILSIALWITMALLSAALLLAFLRLWRGPSLPDRVIALDLILTIGVGFVAAYAIANQQPVFLDALLILVLIGFLGTVAFAYYLERSGQR